MNDITTFNLVFKIPFSSKEGRDETLEKVKRAEYKLSEDVKDLLVFCANENIKLSDLKEAYISRKANCEMVNNLLQLAKTPVASTFINHLQEKQENNTKEETAVDIPQEPIQAHTEQNNDSIQKKADTAIKNSYSDLEQQQKEEYEKGVLVDANSLQESLNLKNETEEDDEEGVFYTEEKVPFSDLSKGQKLIYLLTFSLKCPRNTVRHTSEDPDLDEPSIVDLE